MDCSLRRNIVQLDLGHMLWEYVPCWPVLVRKLMLSWMPCELALWAFCHPVVLPNRNIPQMQGCKTSLVGLSGKRDSFGHCQWFLIFLFFCYFSYSFLLSVLLRAAQSEEKSCQVGRDIQPLLPCALSAICFSVLSISKRVPVLVSARRELIFFLVAGTVLGFGFSVRILLITLWCFSCC